MQKDELNIAFIYDWFDTPQGGAERVLQVLHEMYPHAPWYTSHIDLKSAPWATGWDVRPSFLQHLPARVRRNRVLMLPLLPLAFESFDLSTYDVVVSISSAFAKAVVTKAHTRHICYLLTPPRWLWTDTPIINLPLIRFFERTIRSYVRRWDKITAQRVDEFIAISRVVADRCNKWYVRESTVVYPPFDTAHWQELLKENLQSIPAEITTLGLSPNHYMLVVSRLETYKRVDVALTAFAMYKKSNPHAQSMKLVIVGTGTQKNRLMQKAQDLGIFHHIIWTNELSERALAWLYTHSRACIMPQEEDYGYVACEAAWCGAPVVAYARGGQQEALEDYPNIVYFEPQDEHALVSALEKIESIQYNAQTYENSHLRRRSRDAFVAAFTQKISEAV